MDENKVIRPMDFVRLTNIDELNVIKDTKNHIGLVKEVSRDGRMSIIWIGETYSQLAWFKSSELEVVDNLVSILTCGLANFRGDGKESADKFYPMNLCYIKISAFAAYNMDNPFLKVRIRNKYHIVPFDDVNKMVSQMVYLMDNYPDFVQIGGWWISKKAVMSWVPKGQAVDGSGWVISFTLSFGLEGGTQIRFDKEDEYLSEIDRLNELFNVIL